MKVIIFGLSGLVSAPSPVPSGESMLSSARASPLPIVKVAVMVEDCPSVIELPADEVMVAVVADGGVTVRVPAFGEQVATIAPVAVVLIYPL